MYFIKALLKLLTKQSQQNIFNTSREAAGYKAEKRGKKGSTKLTAVLLYVYCNRFPETSIGFRHASLCRLLLKFLNILRQNLLWFQ